MNFPIFFLTVFGLAAEHVFSQEEARTDQDVCGRANSQSTFRVLGGQQAAECEFPWMVIVSVTPQTGDNKTCAGSIIDESHVLTSAICVSHRNSNRIFSTSEVTVYSGTSNANSPLKKENKVERIVSHSRFSPTALVNDIAVVELQEPITFDECHRPICLFQEGEYIPVQDLETCRVMGWGRISNRNTSVSENLLWTPQRAATANQCARTYRRRQGTFCASGTRNNGICYGDSGAPLVCQHEDGRYFHYGIASLIIAGRCGSRYALYTSVNDFLPWINAAKESPEPRSDDEVCGQANTQSTFRVVGGQKAAECEFPWMVFLSIRSGGRGLICGGSIIDARHVLTAAHCVTPRNSNRIYPASQITVYSGTSILSTRRSQSNAVDKIIAHSRYSPRSLVNDIAVIKLRQPIKFDRCHRPICMFREAEYIQVQSQQKCRVMGWGKTQNGNTPVSTDLMWAPQMAQSSAQCARTFRIRQGTFCAGGQRGTSDNSGSCNGDSGGPFTCQHSDGRYYQYGIVSAGVPNQCGVRSSLYSDVYYFRNWIKEAMAEE